MPRRDSNKKMRDDWKPRARYKDLYPVWVLELFGLELPRYYWEHPPVSLVKYSQIKEVDRNVGHRETEERHRGRNRRVS
jgi:hypothetical protein